MDADGYVRITGRIKDLIIKGGENIHPLEVENCLFAHPAIREVSVAGLPDERYGEVVAAFVVKHDEAEGEITADEVRAWVREKLSHHLGKFCSDMVLEELSTSDMHTKLIPVNSAKVCILR
jgi:acyl-CoA synthetase (AMP-forming)/AMP-acid ligase II